MQGMREGSSKGSPPAVGTIGLAGVHGSVGRLIEIGEWLNGDGFGTWEHAFLTLSPNTDVIIEAEPGGARFGHWSVYPEIYWCHNIRALPGLDGVSVARHATKYLGTPYSFLDYFALAAHRLHIPAPALQSYIADSGHMICSQLVTQAHLDDGFKLFPNEWPGYVTPLALHNLDQALGR